MLSVDWQNSSRLIVPTRHMVQPVACRTVLIQVTLRTDMFESSVYIYLNYYHVTFKCLSTSFNVSFPEGRT